MNSASGWEIDKTIRYASNNLVHDVHEHNIDLKANHIFLVGEASYATSTDDDEPGVEYLMASRFIKNLNLLMRKSSDPILVHLKTCGGSWQEGMAIYDAIKSCPNPLTILAYAEARSMSSIILQASDKRVMMPHAKFMFHQGSVTQTGTVKEFLTEAEQCKMEDTIMIGIYTEAME